MIKTVIKCANGMVMVFDKRGRQIPKYQGQCEEVKERILKDAPPDTVFGYFPDDERELKVISREDW